MFPRRIAFGGVLAVSLAASVLVVGCSIGQGTGDFSGPVLASDCDIDEPEYALQPSFFTAEVTGGQLNIRVQRGSDFESYADGLMILVRDVNEVKESRIGLPIRLENDYRSLVQVVFYLNESCLTGFPDEFRLQPVVLPAVSGTIIFRSIYAPDVDTNLTGIEADLTDVRFEDPEQPDVRNATLTGSFSFFYQRGSPAQRFP